MTALDEFTKLKKLGREIAGLQWTCGFESVRMFDRRYDSERNVNAKDLALIRAAIDDSEHSGAALVYYGGYVIGDALRACTLRFIDKELKRLAAIAEQEAKDCLEVLGSAKL